MRTEPTTEELKWTAHPIVDRLIPPLSEEELKGWLAKEGGFEAAMGYWESHERAIQEAAADPLRKGFEFQYWKDFRELLARKDAVYALGGNGPGKTEIGSKLVVETLMSGKGKRVLCVAQSEGATRQLQQPTVYKYLPPALRSVNETGGTRKRQRVSNVTFSPKGGFTENTFVLPNRSQCWFKTVEQYERDRVSFEGPEYDLVWIDEPAPIELVETLEYRVAKRRGKFFFTFTAVEGFDAVCANVLTGARLVKSLPMNWVWREAGENPNTKIQIPNKSQGPNPENQNEQEDEDEEDLAVGQEAEGFADPRVIIPELKMEEVQVKGCPRGHMPYMMQPLDAAKGVIFLWSHWNLFLPRYREDPRDARTENAHWPQLFKTAKGKSARVVRTRLFGWAEKIAGCQFPLFNPAVHVIERERVPLAGTDYHAGDPAQARSFFFLWARVDRTGRKFIFDESPGQEEGEWVTANGERGEGQKIFAGRGVDFHKAHIRGREKDHGQTPVRRKGDPRGFATEAAAREGGQSLFELFANDGGTAETAPMFFEPAKVRQTILLDLEKINDDLAYDPDKPISVENEPRLYISERCQNLIRAMLNWSPDQGSDSPYKDPVDTLRYLNDEPLYYQDPSVPEVVGGSGW